MSRPLEQRVTEDLHQVSVATRIPEPPIDELMLAGRRRLLLNRAVGAVAAVAALLVVIAGVGLVPRWVDSSRPGQPIHHGPTPPPSHTSGSKPRGWRSFNTSVQPGSAVQFASSQYGWQVAGLDANLDGNLSAAPIDTGYDRPGDAVLATDDGGTSWHPILDGTTDGLNGIWGVDLYSTRAGWVVGVTSLVRTENGGASWTRMGEPDGTHLVSVDFSSSRLGLGLTTDGDVVTSDDAGQSWRSAGLDQKGTSLCRDSDAEFVVNLRGDIYTSTDHGVHWRLGYRDTTPSFGPVWSQTTCHGTEVWSSAQYTARLHNLGPKGQPYTIVHSADAGRTWSTVISRTATFNERSSQLADLWAALGTSGLAQSRTGEPFVVDFPGQGWAIDTAALSDGAVTALSPIASLPRAARFTNASEYLEIHGAYATANDRWILVTDIAVWSGQNPKYQTFVLHTSANGQVWSVLNAGPRISFRQQARLRRAANR
jgi:photosystem II stability/assembly factor-like uncharacterized protein